jgi:hypothetical protein
MLKLAKKAESDKILWGYIYSSQNKHIILYYGLQTSKVIGILYKSSAN